ncbi:MAG: hypothetical protein H6579_01635 [Chitinophagales bacterium]|nr:hypothetical protein [Chitinophagales bacterium]
MKIYKNPDGNLDLLYPSLFFGSCFSIVFFYSRTIISLSDLAGIGAFAFLFAFLSYYLLARKYKLFEMEYINLFLATTATPFLVAIFLLVNFSISFKIYDKKLQFADYLICQSGKSCYFSDAEVPDNCRSFMVVHEPYFLRNNHCVRITIAQGLFNFPVLRHKIFMKE